MIDEKINKSVQENSGTRPGLHPFYAAQQFSTLLSAGRTPALPAGKLGTPPMARCFSSHAMRGK